MKRNRSNRSAFFNLRALIGLALCFASVALAVFAFKPSAEQPARYMPVPGANPQDEATGLAQLEQYWSDRLTYPTGKFNPAWLRQAAAQHARVPIGIPAGRKKTKAQLALSPLALSPTSFTALGPQPERMTGCSGCFNYTTTQGRVNVIAVDPTTTINGNITAYLGSVGGGVWKTTNCCSDTTTWSVTTDDPLVSTTAIDALTIDPNDHNTIYAGTGDLNYGSFSMGSQGILKSTDAGATWVVLGADVFGAAYTQPPGQFPQYNAVGKVRVDPNNSNNVVAGTKKGLYFSYDGGTNWTGPCTTNSFNTQRQDITGLELTNMGGGVTRIIVAVGVRGFPTFVQYDLGANGANGIYKGTMPSSGCPTDFTPISRNDNGFVFGTQVTGSPYTTGANMNADSGVPCNYPITGGTGVCASNTDQLGRIDVAVAPSDPNVLYAQVQSIEWNSNSGCGNTNGCQLGVWSSIDGGDHWSYMEGSQGGSLRNCTNGQGDYPQNWYDQAVAVDPNNPDRVFVSTFDVWFATRTGTSFNDTTCGYSYSGSAGPVHVDQHALAFLPGSSSILLIGNDGGAHGTTNSDIATASVDPTWFNMDAGLNTIEFYSGDISGNFATSAGPMAVGGAQDNGPSSVTFAGTPTGPALWQLGLGGDGFSGQIDPMGTGQTQAQGTITLVTGGSVAGETFMIGTQTFTFAATRTVAGTVAVNTSTTTEGNNIVAAINADIPAVATAVRSGATVIVTATVPGPAGNAIPFTEAATNFSMNGSGTLGGTRLGDDIGSLRVWEGNNSGGLSRCIYNCTAPGATWTSSRGSWTGDLQSFILPINMFHGGIPGGDDCDPAGLTTGCGHLIAGTTRVWETISGAAATVPISAWYITNNPAGAAGGPNLTKGTLGNRSFINQVKYSPKYQSVAIVGTNDGNVQIGFNLGTGVASQANWVNVTGANGVLPNRPVLGIALDPSVAAANIPVGYAAVGGFNANTPTTPGHVFQVTCAATCGSFAWLDKTGNLPDIPVDSVIVNPNFPQQVFAGTDWGVYYTNDVTVASPLWYRFENGLPHAMIWDMQIDRGATTLSVWTRGRGAFAYPLSSSPIVTPTSLAVSPATGIYGGTTDLSATLTAGGSGVSGESISFTLNSSPVGSATTNGSGVATLSSASLSGIDAGTYPSGVGASFAGDSNYASSSASNSLTIDAIISVSASPAKGGTVTGGGTYSGGSTATVQATAGPGYDFANWTENGVVVSTSASYAFTVTASRTLVANFVHKPVISLSVSSTSVNKGGSAIFTATTDTVNPSQTIAVAYSLSGSAALGTDYTLSGTPGQIDIPPGASTGSVTLQVTTTQTSGSEKATMTLQPGSLYGVSNKSTESVTIHNK